jgi:hypothetical protein
MGSTDTIKLWITYLTAAILAIGSLGLAVWTWTQPAQEGRDIALIFGLLGTAFGGSTAFLFGQEAATRAARSSEKSHEAGVYAGLAQPFTGSSMPQAYEDEFHGDPADGDLADTSTTSNVTPLTPPTS